MHNDNIPKHNISKKEKEELLSLFRIPINFFSDNNKLNNFHNKFKKLKEEIDNTIANLPSNTVNDDMNELDDDDEDITDELDDDDEEDVTDDLDNDEKDVTGELDDDDEDIKDELYDDDEDIMDELDDDDEDVMDELDGDDNNESIKKDKENKDEDSKDEQSDETKQNNKPEDESNSAENDDMDINSTNSDKKDDSSLRDKTDSNAKEQPKSDESPSSTPSGKDTDKSIIDNARNMNKKPDATGDIAKNATGDAAKNAAGDVAKNAAGNAANAAGNAANTAGNAAGAAVGGAGAVLGAANALKDAKNDPEAAAGQLAVEGVKGVAQLLDAAAPGVGSAVSTGIGAIDSTVGQTEIGKKGKRCCGSCICTSCILILWGAFLPILLILMTFSSIFGSNDLKKEEKDKNFIEIIQENTDLSNPKSYLTDILDEALDKVEYPKYKAAVEANELYRDINGSIYILSIMSENYSPVRLKKPAIDSRPEDFPLDENINDNHILQYYGMESKHIPMFEELLNDPDVLKQMFNMDSKMNKFIDDIIDVLDNSYRIFNASSGLYEDNVSLRDLFEQVSLFDGDTQYDATLVDTILNDQAHNQEIIKNFHVLQEQLAKLEILTYMQAYRQYYMQISDMRRKALNGNYALPDVYYTDEFFEQFSTITDLATYVSLAVSTPDSSLVYEIACDAISIWKDPPELTAKTFNGKEIRYIPILETWYANYTFDLVTTGNTAILKCTGVQSRQLDEQDWEESSNLLKRYIIDNKEKFFALFKTATGIDPVEGDENIYSPSGLDSTWQTEATFNIGSTKAYSSGIYSYTNSSSSYSSNMNAPAGSPSYSYSTTTYLTETGGSFPLAATNVRITMNFMERYPQYIIDTYGTSEYHRGIDYAVPIGTPVLAIREGIVTDAKPSAGYGNYVEVTHPDGSRSRYGHGNGVFNVKKGDTVSAGTQIMESGNSGNSTGPHMHLEVIGSDGKLIDPNKYIYEKPY